MYWQCCYCYAVFGSKDAYKNHNKDKHNGYPEHCVPLNTTSFNYPPQYPPYGYGYGTLAYPTGTAMAVGGLGTAYPAPAPSDTRRTLKAPLPASTGPPSEEV